MIRNAKQWFFGLVLVTAVSMPCAARAQQVAVHVDSAKLHALRDSASSWVQLKRGAILTLVERSPGWMSVEMAGMRGFIREQFVIVIGDRVSAADSRRPIRPNRIPRPRPAERAPSERRENPVPQPSVPATAPASVPATVPASVPESVPATVPESVPESVPATVPARTVRGRSAPLGPSDLGYKDPTVARVFAILLPGGGNLYAGDLDTGAALLGSSLAALAIGAGLSTDDESRPLYAGYVVALGAWVYGFLMAEDAAERANIFNAGRVMVLVPTAEGVSLSISLPTGPGR